MAAPVLPVLKLALPLLPVAILLRLMVSGYAGLVAWWVAMADGIITREEKRAIVAAMLAVELMAVTVARGAVRIIMEPLGHWRPH